MRVLMVFIDGFGLGLPEEKFNPYTTTFTPALDFLLGGHNLYQGREIANSRACLTAADACLGVPGIPQSATGQATLWTGVNAARLLGHHQQGFPSPSLKALLAQENIFLKVKAQGKEATFANAFWNYFLDPHKPTSTSTTVALAAGISLRTIVHLLKGEAVFQDITNGILCAKGAPVPLVSPEVAGERLAALGEKHDFTLFEYFQSDRAGHAQDLGRGREILGILDAFLGSLVKKSNLGETLIIVTSDHGNLEDLSTPTHTHNPVPAILIGRGKEEGFRNLKSIADLTPFILSLLSGS